MSGAVREAVDSEPSAVDSPARQRRTPSDFASVAPLFAGNPADPLAWRATIERVQRAPHDREALAAAGRRPARGARRLRRKRSARPPKLADPAAVAVVNGAAARALRRPALQPPYKALTALRCRGAPEEHGVRRRLLGGLRRPRLEGSAGGQLLVADYEVADVSPQRTCLSAGTYPVASLGLDEGVDDAVDGVDTELARRNSRRGPRGPASALPARQPDVDGFRGLAGRAVGTDWGSSCSMRPIGGPSRSSPSLRRRARAARARGATGARGRRGHARLGQVPQVSPAEDAVLPSISTSTDGDRFAGATGIVMGTPPRRQGAARKRSITPSASARTCCCDRSSRTGSS